MNWLLKMISGNPLVSLWAALAVFGLGVASGGGAAWFVQGLRLTHAEQEFTKFRQDTKEAGLAAKENKLRIENEHKDNLAKVVNDNEEKLPKIRSEAVANYLAAHPANVVRDKPRASSGSSGVRGDGSGIKLDDGAGKECVPDTAFIQDAAEDASKVSAWIEYCTLNHCPISEQPGYSQ